MRTLSQVVGCGGFGGGYLWEEVGFFAQHIARYCSVQRTNNSKGNSRSFDCDVRKCANLFAQDDNSRVGVRRTDKSNSKSEMRGSLSTALRFGRDDASEVEGEGEPMPP